MNIRKNLKSILLIILITLIAELLLFNMRAIQSVFYQTSQITDYDFEISGAEVNPETGNLEQTADAVTVEVKNINCGIENVHIDVEVTDSIESGDTESGVVYFDLYADDQSSLSGDENAYMPYIQQKILHSVPASCYIWFESYGDINNLRMHFRSPSGINYRIDDISFNAKRPLIISWRRLLFVFCVLLTAYSFRGNSELWNKNALDTMKKNRGTVIILYAVLFVASAVWMFQNKAINSIEFEPYQELAHSLANGQNFLDFVPSDVMQRVGDSPAFWSSNDDIPFDYAYHRGRFYVYFGILPCLVFYLPAWVLFGINVRNTVPLLLVTWLIILEIRSLLKQMIKIWYPGTSYAAFILLEASCICGCGLPWAVSHPDSYLLTILSGVALTVAGLTSWIGAFYKKDKPDKVKLGIGSLFMAAVSLCRPNMLIYSFMIIPLFVGGGCLKKVKGLNKKDNITYILSVVIPYFIFAVAAMYYNYSRFGSVLDFGAEYNQTGMPELMRTPFAPALMIRGIYEYFFRMPVSSPEFPFNDWQIVKGELGQGNNFFTESMGGLLPLNPVLGTILLIIPFRNKMKERKSAGLFFALISFVLIMVSVTSICSGAFTIRYIYEFSIIVYAAYWLVALEAMALCKDIPYDISVGFRNAFMLLSLLGILIFGIGQLFMDGWYPLYEGNTDLYYKVYYDFMFF